MPWRRGLRKGAKWAIAMAVVLVVVAWAASLRWCMYWARADYSRDTGGYLRNGAIFAHSSPLVVGRDVVIFPGFHVNVLPPDEQWRCFWTPRLDDYHPGIYIEVPLWIPFVLTLLPAALLWRADIRATRRERQGRCPKCNYDRRGLAADAKCPECGTVPTKLSHEP